MAVRRSVFVASRGRSPRRATALALGVLLGVAGCGRDAGDDAKLARSNLQELLVQDLAPGHGEAARRGDTVRVHYTGWLYHPDHAEHKGTEFDSSRARSEPFEFTLGAGEVIRGWEQGVEGMRPGGRRRLTIPPALAYGSRGAGGVIPPDATLVFEVELIDAR